MNNVISTVQFQYYFEFKIQLYITVQTLTNLWCVYVYYCYSSISTERHANLLHVAVHDTVYITNLTYYDVQAATQSLHGSLKFTSLELNHSIILVPS